MNSSKTEKRGTVGVEIEALMPRFFIQRSRTIREVPMKERKNGLGVYTTLSPFIASLSTLYPNHESQPSFLLDGMYTLLCSDHTSRPDPGIAG